MPFSFSNTLAHPPIHAWFYSTIVKLRDINAWEIFLSLLASIREQEISEFLRQNVTNIAGITLTCKSRSTDILFLVKKDIPLILELIVRFGHKWELLGTILGLPIEEINVWTITDNKIGLTKVLTYWIDQLNKPATLNQLKEALNGEIMGEGRLAQNLEDRFKKAKNAMRCSSTAESGPFSLRIANQSNTEVTDGKSTLLLVEASCRQLVSYEWKKDDKPLVNDSTYSGVNEDLFVIKFASQGIEGEYTCHVSNQGKKVCSNKITLSICYPPSKKRLLNLYNVQREVLSDSSPLMVTCDFIDLNLKKSSTEDIKDSIYEDKDKPEFRDYL